MILPVIILSLPLGLTPWGLGPNVKVGAESDAALRSGEPGCEPQQADDLRPLAVGAPIERQLSGGETHTYRIALSAGQFALLQVEQRGAEVLLAANGPDGKEFAAVDLRFGVGGVEPLAVVAEVAGEYLLKVTSRNPKGVSGTYQARISDLRAATERDRTHLKAQTLCHEAQPLGLEKAPEAKRKAVRLYEEALPLWRKVPEPFWEASLLRRLGRLHIDLTDFRRAKEYFGRAVVAMKAVGDRRGEVSAQSGLCEALNYLSDEERRAECFDLVIAIRRTAMASPGRPGACLVYKVC